MPPRAVLSPPPLARRLQHAGATAESSRHLAAPDLPIFRPEHRRNLGELDQRSLALATASRLPPVLCRLCVLPPGRPATSLAAMPPRQLR